MTNTNRPDANLQTLYYSKRFTSGLLKGLTVHNHLTASPKTLRSFRIGTIGRDALTRDRYVIVDASFQNYVR